FAAANLLMGLYAGLYDPSFNNYLAQVHHVSEVTRGSLEFPRELPGFLVVFFFTALIFLADTRIGALAAIMVGISLWGQGYLAPGMTSVVFWMLLWSTGAHLFMVLKSSIALRLTSVEHAGRLLGRLGALEAWGGLTGMLIIYYGVSRFNFSFGVIFGIAGTFALLAALCMFLIKPEPIKTPPRQLLLKRKYSLYYILCMLFGARKQVFLTFAPWVLIKLFGCQVQTFALLGIIGTVISMGFRPLLGSAIDAWGERTIIILDSLFLVTICILYGFAPQWFSTSVALIVVMTCYIIDQLLFAVSMARTTYLNRIADTRDDIAPTISMGTTLDHAVSMLVPIGGGLLWAYYGYQWVFATAGIIALVTLVVSLRLPRHDAAICNSSLFR
ncbi:MAG: MFS transporter, partial [Syntrophomonadaceae bacterium]|nr:MFS transporter [Syntrophomonadaceae bacterium]